MTLAVAKDSRPFVSASSKNCAAVLFFVAIEASKKRESQEDEEALANDIYTAKGELADTKRIEDNEVGKEMRVSDVKELRQTGRNEKKDWKERANYNIVGGEATTGSFQIERGLHGCLSFKVAGQDGDSKRQGSRKGLSGSMREQRGRTREQRGSMGEHRGSTEGAGGASREHEGARRRNGL